MQRKSLSDILRGNDGYFDGWNDVQAADEFGSIPPGVYVAHLVASETFNARTKGTPGYKLTFRIIEGEHAGRQVWYDIWLTEGTKRQAKRDFDKLGITNPKQQLERPLPQGIRCRLKVVLHKADDGTEFNKVKTFDVVGIDTPPADPFAPQDATKPAPQPQAADESAGGFDDRF